MASYRKSVNGSFVYMSHAEERAIVQEVAAMIRRQAGCRDNRIGAMIVVQRVDRMAQITQEWGRDVAAAIHDKAFRQAG